MMLVLQVTHVDHSQLPLLCLIAESLCLAECCWLGYVSQPPAASTLNFRLSCPQVSFSSGVGALVWLWKDELLFCEQAQLQQAAILWLAQALAKAKHQIYLLVPLCCSPEMQLTAPLLLDYFVSVEVSLVWEQEIAHAASRKESGELVNGCFVCLLLCLPGHSRWGSTMFVG